jgi:hypothetical protein
MQKIMTKEPGTTDRLATMHLGRSKVMKLLHQGWLDTRMLARAHTHPHTRARARPRARLQAEHGEEGE